MITNKALRAQLLRDHGVQVHSRNSPKIKEYEDRGPTLPARSVRPCLLAFNRVLTDLKTRFGMKTEKLDLHLLLHDAEQANASALAWFPSANRKPAISVSNQLFDANTLKGDIPDVRARYSAGKVKLYAGTQLLTTKRIKTRIEDYQDAILRHEIAHLMTIDADKRRFRKEFPKDHGGLHILQHKVSIYATRDIFEGIAELFAKITSPTYDGSLKKYEYLVDHMLKRYK